jgi:hypothetical protein
MFILALVTFLLSLPLLATTQISSGIYDIDFAKGQQSENLVLLNTGQVARMPSGKTFLLNKLMRDQKRNLIYNFILDEERFIVDAQVIGEETKKTSPLMTNKSVQTYVPTTIASMNIAKKYFREARYNPKDSQCFNRAIVWTYEWWRKHSLKSNKLLIFFTRTYIRRYNFEWWFHIAPYVHVIDEGKVVERMMDVKYTRGPIDFRRWTNIFTNRDPECPVITKFSDYADNPYIGDCYIQRTNMYTYQPADLQMYEAWNYVKDKFLMTEVKQAYLEAFDENISKNARD